MRRGSLLSSNKDDNFAFGGRAHGTAWHPTDEFVATCMPASSHGSFTTVAISTIGCCICA
jgi:hypothetical protein